MGINWSRIAHEAVFLTRRYGPMVVRGVNSQLRQRSAARAALDAKRGRPAATIDHPAADLARKIQYSPELDGRADPGEIVWTWVEFEEHDGRGKDRPVLVVGRDRRTLLGLMLSSQAKRAGEANWQGIGSGAWDHDGKPSWVRLDRVLEVPEDGIRREGAIADRDDFELIANRLRTEYGWR